MSVITRIKRLWKADIHGVMDRLEDQPLMLKQYLREMENSLQEKESDRQQVAETDQQIQNDLMVREKEIEKLEKDITLALRKGKDDIARMLIRKQRQQRTHCHQLQQQHESLEGDHHHLCQVIEEQRLRYETLKLQTQTFCRRSEHTSFIETNDAFSESGCSFTYDEEEIEIELIRRKEAHQKEGGGL